VHVKIATLLDQLCSQSFGGLSNLLIAGWRRLSNRKRYLCQCEYECKSNY
jgi:hypothetical protein